MIFEKDILSRIKDNKVFFLGQVQITDDEYKELLNYARIRVRTVSPSMGIRSDVRLSICLVQVAIREYKEGKYWPFFCEALEESVPASKMNFCGKIFAATVKELGLLYIDRNDSSNQMYVENIKVHAMVTNYYMHGFWDFLSAYYEKNLFRQISDDLDEDIELLSLFMKSTLDSNSDSFVGEESEGHASKSYKLLKATRNLIAYSDVDSINSFILPSLRIIDEYYYDSELPDNNERFGYYFANWCHEKEAIDKKNVVRNRNRLLSSKRPFIHFDFNNLIGYINIPSQKFRENECEGEGSAEITINGYKKEVNLEIYKSFGIYISEKIRLPIPSIFDEIDICIESCIAKKYKISQSNYRILNKNGDIVTKLSLGDNLLLVEKNNKVTFEGLTKCIDFSDEYQQFDYYSITASEDTIVHIGKKTISLAGEYSEAPYFADEVFDFKVYDEDDNQLIVSRSHPTISFLVNENKISGTVLVVNGLKKPIDEISEKVISAATRLNEKAVTIDLENVIPGLDAAYDINIDIPDEKNIIIPKYVRLNKLEVFFSKGIYSTNENVFIWIRNGEGRVWPEKEDVELVDIQLKGDKYLVPFVENENELVLNLELNELFKIKMELPIFKVGFSIDELSYTKPEYVWYSNLKETLYFSSPNVTEIKVYLNHERNDFINGYPIGKGIFRIDISSLKKKISENDREQWAYINAWCIGTAKYSIQLFQVLRVIWVEPYFDFKAINGVLCFDMAVKGDAQLEVDIEDDTTKEKYIKAKRITNGVTALPELPINGTYNIIPRMIESDDFGLNQTVSNLRPIFSQIYISSDDLTNCRLTVADLYNWDEKISLSFDYFIDIREKTANGYYVGNMFGLKKCSRHTDRNRKEKYEKGKDGKLIKKRFGKVSVKILSEDDKSLYLQVYTSTYNEINSDWIELYYDSAYQTLLHCNDNALNNTNSYDRFVFLEAEVTKYKVIKKKIRRLKTYAI